MNVQSNLGLSCSFVVSGRNCVITGVLSFHRGNVQNSVFKGQPGSGRFDFAKLPVLVLLEPEVVDGAGVGHRGHVDHDRAAFDQGVGLGGGRHEDGLI